MTKFIFVLIILIFSSANAEVINCLGANTKEWNNCIGSKKYEDGIYNGKFINGKKDGYGEIIYNDGLIIKGWFSNDLMNGQIEVIFDNGNKQKGYYKNGEYQNIGFNIDEVNNILSKNFEISGFRFQDSLLNYFDEDFILKNARFDFYEYKKDKKFYLIGLNNPKYTRDFQQIIFTLKKNDKTYKIHGISGKVFFIENINDCKKLEKKISKIISKNYKYKDKDRVIIDTWDEIDRKSFYSGTNLVLKTNEVISSYCYNWSKETGKSDNYKLSFFTKDLSDWIEN